MRKDYMEWAYETMACGLIEGHRMPGVEYEFLPGRYALEQYGEVYDAYERLRDRLGVVDCDDDVEIIINAFFAMQRDLCYRMYRYGAQFGMGDSK